MVFIVILESILYFTEKARGESDEDDYEYRQPLKFVAGVCVLFLSKDELKQFIFKLIYSSGNLVPILIRYMKQCTTLTKKSITHI